jgi:hypothetical protein
MIKDFDKYSLSFTAASFRLHDFLRLAIEIQYSNGIINIKDINAEKILSKGNERTSSREMAEFIKRYNSLTDSQKSILIDGNIDEQKNITFLGILKSNSFIKDFVLEVARDKLMVFDFVLSDADFKSFVNRKSELHQELDEFADSTIDKARQTLFKILADAGLIDNIKSRNIIQPWLSQRVINSIVADNYEYLKFFLLSDSDINLIVNR